jgi:hypothetical protein
VQISVGAATVSWEFKDFIIRKSINVIANPFRNPNFPA